jgi:iron-sulfur cluster insertion protein
MQTAATAERIDSFVPQIAPDELSVTPAAQAKLRELLAEVDPDEVVGVRIYVGGGGCSGMTYGMTFADQRSEFDLSLDFDGVSVLVDAVALNYLKGAEIDFVAEFGRERFVFNNVFSQTGGSGTCGACGAAGGGCA